MNADSQPPLGSLRSLAHRTTLQRSVPADLAAHAARTYLGLDPAAILHGFRRQAGIDSSSAGLTGWCTNTSGVVLGQWISGLSRNANQFGPMYHDRAVELAVGWFDAATRTGSHVMESMDHYAVDKMIGGLVDVVANSGNGEALAALNWLVDWSTQNLDQRLKAARPNNEGFADGRPLEWYTLSENLYRAYEVTGDRAFQDFAKLWHYDDLWDRFDRERVTHPPVGVHAYSHCNAMVSAVAASRVLRDDRLLRVGVRAHDWMVETQCYSSGGYGPAERLVRSRGDLLRALYFRTDNFEVCCGTWAGFKLTQQLQQLTGEARFGDWMERLVYNGLAAALPITSEGRHSYYSDYRVSGGARTYFHDTFACCSGTYAQLTATLPDLVFLAGDDGVHINLYLPSTLTTRAQSGDGIRFRVETDYPLSSGVLIEIEEGTVRETTISLRIPTWSTGATADVAGRRYVGQPGTWLKIRRQWSAGDRIQLDVPLRFRYETVSDRSSVVSVMRGPLVFGAENHFHEDFPRLPLDGNTLDDALVNMRMSPSSWHVPGEDGRNCQATLQPLYAFRAFAPYRSHFDLARLPDRLWT